MQQIEHAMPSRQSTWDTAGVRSAEQFAYYREAICQAFMNLTPEPAAALGFPASVEHVRLGGAAINRVSFPEHVVRRSAADIAASDRSCFYLNLKLGGRCRIQQDGREISLSPGQVGIFASDRQFALLHDRGPQLQVASFWVPSEALRERLPASLDVTAGRVSDDPFVGHLIAETARTLTDGALRMTEDAGERLFRVLIELVAVSLSRQSRAGTAESESLVDATTLALKRAIHRRLREPGLSVANVAAAVGISERYVHKLLARSGSSFTDYVIDQRLDGAARDLRNPAMAERAIGLIAFDWGFSDLSHFTRRFKQRFGCRPRDWRAG
ncbi:helix-turn-helix domain-containing protein [Bradyrhizobium sp. IC3069]|uniref:helix-turn-helix domain-containing protein n=1 Tax=unclassified Bradyrhizobium TaxID=2631580 RepID=UPI001CD357AA|nr:MULTISPECIES: helix-turn-helix domain-containing protein [unclassified Bradyrhizobium]MCA1362981.1 helix-turn-helix domain-containing protein [Bradyrhizobium sp. IC4059]MCA1472490.1 helix-turn-helix domain-containing protein [Bradyrhizobium sp. IC3195]MCA1521869.1 helix-turn-helix domain-containing protein [Bradyrhizobium sp. IC3069]